MIIMFFKLFTIGANSKGISLGSEVGYTPGKILMTSTPSFVHPLVCFNKVMDLLEQNEITTHYIHQHVILLQRRFFKGLDDLEKKGECSIHISPKTLQKPLAPEFCRSHVLVFVQKSTEEASECIRLLRKHKIGIDSRKHYVRLGFGLNHNPEDVERLLACLTTH